MLKRKNLRLVVAIALTATTVTLGGCDKDAGTADAVPAESSTSSSETAAPTGATSEAQAASERAPEVVAGDTPSAAGSAEDDRSARLREAQRRNLAARSAGGPTNKGDVQPEDNATLQTLRPGAGPTVGKKPVASAVGQTKPGVGASSSAANEVRTVDPAEAIAAAERAKNIRKGVDTGPVQPASVVLYPQRLELGEIPTGDSRTGVVRLVNEGTKPYTLVKCKTSCGCTTANCQEGLILQPGDSTEVEIKLDGGERARRLTKTVTFLFDDGHPPLPMQLVAESVTFVTFSPERLDPDVHSDGAITLTSKDGEPFSIQSMYPPVIEGLPTEPASTVTVHLDWARMKEEGHRQRQLLLRLNHPKCSKVSVPLSPTYWRETNAAGQAAKQLDAASRAQPATPATGSNFGLDTLLQKGQDDVVLQMLEEGRIKINQPDSGAQTPLIKACRWGVVSVIGALIDAGSSLEAVDKMGRTPLMYACQSKNIEAVRVLLDAGASIEQPDMIGNTAICWAAGFGNGDIVEELLSAGAKVEVKPGMIGFTPLIWASGFGDKKSVELLLEAGADVEAADVLQGATCLMHAVRTGKMENVVLLLAAEANLEARDNEGSTPILVACGNAGPDADMIELLVQRGAVLTARDNVGKHVLDHANNRTDPRSAAVLAAITKALTDADLLTAEGQVKVVEDR